MTKWKLTANETVWFNSHFTILSCVMKISSAVVQCACDHFKWKKIQKITDGQIIHAYQNDEVRNNIVQTRNREHFPKYHYFLREGESEREKRKTVHFDS